MSGEGIGWRRPSALALSGSWKAGPLLGSPSILPQKARALPPSAPLTWGRAPSRARRWARMLWPGPACYVEPRSASQLGPEVGPDALAPGEARGAPVHGALVPHRVEARGQARDLPGGSGGAYEAVCQGPPRGGGRPLPAEHGPQGPVGGRVGQHGAVEGGKDHRRYAKGGGVGRGHGVSQRQEGDLADPGQGTGEQGAQVGGLSDDRAQG